VSSQKTPFWWTFLALTLGLDAFLIGLGIYLLSTNRTVEQPERIAVPYAETKDVRKGNEDLWEPWHRWVIMEDGRMKPFETYCIESLRTITGRATILDKDGNKVDAVPVVVSWMMLYETDGKGLVEVEKRPGNRALAEQADEDAIRKASKEMNCDWDNYPFILCDLAELREKLYRAKLQDEELTAEQKHGKFIEPSILRNNAALKELTMKAMTTRMADKKAEIPLIESKAEEVANRFALYERIRSGGELESFGPNASAQSGDFRILSLDDHNSTWFSLKSVRVYSGLPKNSSDHKQMSQGMMWANVHMTRKEKNHDAYDGKPVQAYPAEDVEKVANAWTAAQVAYRSKDKEKFKEASQNFVTTVNEVNARRNHVDRPADKSNVELWYNKANPFQKAWIISLLAGLTLALTVLIQTRWVTVAKVTYGIGLALFVSCIACAAAGFYCRVEISGRAPVSNMYESIIWVAFMTAVFGLIFEAIYRKGFIALAGAIVATIGFVLADQLPNMFSPNLQPLVAVLDSNYWLIVHVLTIVSSYAALALAWGLGNLNMGLILYQPERKDLIKTLTHFSYRAIQVGVAMLFLGTMLGGFWADKSWGRFWGWDPKEVWALIAFLVYMIPLHARYAGWLKDFGLAVVSVVCFSFVVMAWYGVNFILGAGLHSYGFGSGGNSWLYFFGLLNLALVMHGALRYMARPEVAPEVAG